MNFEIQNNISLKPYNTFGIDASAQNFIQITDEIQLVSLYKASLFQEPFFTLGGGSNVLFTRDIDQSIIQIDIKGIHHFIQGSQIYITAAGGEIWNDLVWYCVERDFPGMENMALIPGTVGASPIQNIGAYGVELMDIFYNCRAFDTHTGEFRNFNHSECQFSYRDSIFKNIYKNRFIITSVTYKLSQHTPINISYGNIQAELQRREISIPNIRDIAEVVSHIRVEKLPDPSMIGNAGSFFKNPIITQDTFERLQSQFPEIVSYPMLDARVKIAAGWLIEYCGWKGKTIGNAGVWKNQALVLVNNGNAKGIEIYELSQRILDDVKRTFDIKLEREINIL